MKSSSLPIAIALFWTLTQAVFADPTPLYYSFTTDAGGGIGRLLADPANGEIRAHDRVFADARARSAKKVFASASGRFLALQLEEVEDRENLVVVDLQGEPRWHDFTGRVDHIEFFGEKLYAGTTAGALHRVDPASGSVEATWNFRRLLDPSGRRPENFIFDESTGALWVSFQKDSRGQRHRGSRIVGIDLQSDAVFADLQLPRDRPELHYDPEVDGRESGPNPEVLHVSPRNNLLFVTLDLYGSLGMMDLDAARAGELKNWTTLSTALDQTMGGAFPDRVGAFDADGREYLLVANASDPGGAVVLDLKSRQIVQRLSVPGGLTTLKHLPKAGVIASGVSGKIKFRGPEGLDRRHEPLKTWFLFEIMDGADGAEPLRVREIQREHYVRRVAPVDAATSPLVYLNLGENSEIWEVIHPAENEARARVQAFGTVQRASK